MKGLGSDSAAVSRDILARIMRIWPSENEKRSFKWNETVLGKGQLGPYDCQLSGLISYC